MDYANFAYYTIFGESCIISSLPCFGIFGSIGAIFLTPIMSYRFLVGVKMAFTTFIDVNEQVIAAFQIHIYKCSL